MRSLLLTILFLTGAVFANAQTFTRITTGPQSNDGGASRSVNWIDIDNDNDLDLYVTNGLTGGENNFLYRNNGGTFEKITSSIIANDGQPSDGASWADYDNDGLVDMCFVNWYGVNDPLFKNNGGMNFTSIVSPVSTSAGYSETCSWGDYNNDGHVDLVITNSGNNANPNGPEFLFKNNGNGTFTKVDTGIVVTDGKFTRGCNWVDVDNDRDLDLFVCNERSQSENLFINNGSGYFTKLTGTTLVTSGAENWTSSWADYDNDGDLDVFVGTWGNQKNWLYRNNGNLSFTKIDTGAVVADNNNAAGSGFADYDNDGDLDLFVTNGYAPNGSFQKNTLFKNNLMESGTAWFQKVTSGDIVTDSTDSFGFAWGDYDADGDMDVFVATTRDENSNNLLYRNDNSNGNKWIDIKCVGVASNKSGIGAKIRIKAVINGSPVWQMQEVDGQSGYCGQNLNLHFGLGNATSIDSVRVEWPLGATDVYTNVQPNNFYKATEGQTLILGINSINTEIPAKFTLHQNYPNPFNPSTAIRYEIAKSSNVKLEVYDVSGKMVAEVVNSMHIPGTYEINFDGAKLASGIYVYKLVTAYSTESKKMILLK